MAAILQPGYLRWDGMKYVLDQDVEIVGPEGDAGPAGGTGPQGLPGIGVGATAVGDLTGTYPNPISVVGLTGTSGVVSFGSGINNPTVTQTTVATGNGNPMTLRAQNTSSGVGGNVNLQSGTGTTAGLVQFLVGNNIAGYFDADSILRISSNSSSTFNWLSATVPVANVTSLYSYTSSVNNQAVFATASGAGQSIVDIVNTSISASGGRLVASGPSDSTVGWASNFIIEQIGTSTSSLLFSKATNSGSSRATLARLYQSGAFTLGNDAHQDTSTEAQAGLTGPVINLGTATGTFTSTANQALLFNIGGSARLQGASDVQFLVGTNLAGSFDSNRILRVGQNPTTTSPLYGSTFPIAGSNSIYACNVTGNSSITNFSQSISHSATVAAINVAAGGVNSNGLTLYGSGSSILPTYATHGVLEQTGGPTSALAFAKIQGDGSNRGILGKLYQTGAWVVGEAVNNDTSSEAQAGLTGTVLNLSAIASGTMTTNTNQALLFNTAGTMNVQGNVGVNFIASTTSVASVVPTKFVTNVGRRARVTTTTTGPYSVQTTDEIVSIGTIAAPFIVTLPSSPTTGDLYTIKDANGSAAAFNITVQGNGNNIDAAATFVLTTNYATLRVIYNGSKWIAI